LNFGFETGEIDLVRGEWGDGERKREWDVRSEVREPMPNWKRLYVHGIARGERGQGV